MSCAGSIRCICSHVAHTGTSTVFLSGVRSFKNPASAQVPHMLAGVSRVGWLSTIFRSPSFPKLISKRLKLCQTSASSPSTENT